MKHGYWNYKEKIPLTHISHENMTECILSTKELLIKEFSALQSQKKHYLMELEKSYEGYNIDTNSLDEPDDEYEDDFTKIPYMYRGMNLSLHDIQTILFDTGLILTSSKRNDEDYLHFSSLPYDAIPHAFDTVGAVISTPEDTQRLAVLFALPPSLLETAGRVDMKGKGHFCISADLPKELLLQGKVYIYNHQKKQLDILVG